MPVKLVTKSGNINLTTGGVPQSQINGLLADQEERLREEYGDRITELENDIDDLDLANRELTNNNAELTAQVNTLTEENTELNTTIDSLEAENDELEEEVADLKEIVGNMPTPVEGVEF